MHSLHQGVRPRDARMPEIQPNLLAGPGLARADSGTALVSSYARVAARTEECTALGTSRFLFSSAPTLEEAQRIGQEGPPRIHQRIGRITLSQRWRRQHLGR